MSSFASSSSSSGSKKLSENVQNKLNAAVASGNNHLDIFSLTSRERSLKKWEIAHIFVKLIAYGGNDNFSGPLKVPIETVSVTREGPKFQLRKLVYGEEIVYRDQYPQMEQSELLVLGLGISINLCRPNSTLTRIDIAGNCIPERDFIDYILKAISLRHEDYREIDFSAQGLTAIKHFGGTVLLRSNDLYIEPMIENLLTVKYYIPVIKDVHDERRPKDTETLEEEGFNCSPLKSISFGRNDIAPIFPYFNHHPQLETLNLNETEFGGRSTLFSFDKMGEHRPEIGGARKKFSFEDNFSQLSNTKTKIYDPRNVGGESVLHIQEMNSGMNLLIRSSMNTWSLLTHLDLSGCGIFDKQAQALRRAIGSEFCRLRHLNLAMNPLDCEMVDTIVRALQINKSLRELNLNSTCEFGLIMPHKLSLDPDPLPPNADRKKQKTDEECENDFSSMLKGMEEALLHNHTLEYLDLGNNELLMSHIIVLDKSLKEGTLDRLGKVVGDEKINWDRQ